MEVNQSTHLLLLPTEILEKIVDFLPLVADRKNLRLTCQLLRNLCNSYRFCRNEAIIWSKENQSDILATFKNSTRGCFNFILQSVAINREVLAFFVQHGAKIQSLSISRDCPPGLLTFVIVQCKALCRLTIACELESILSLDSSRVTRPTVTFLKLWDSAVKNSSRDIFDRISSVFPCVKHLNISESFRSAPDSDFLDFAANFSYLESLKLDILLREPFSEKQKFLNALPKLKRLYLSFDERFEERSDFWNTFASLLNVSSIEFVPVIEPVNIAALLSVTSLEHLSYLVVTIGLDIEVLKAFVVSQLKTINLTCDNLFFVDTLTDLRIKANETVTDMNLMAESYEPDNNAFVMVLFASHFHALIHLQIGAVKDEILRSIFKYQKNLRSLVLLECADCTEDGFCGTEDTEFDDSITNLQELEHLSVDDVSASVIQTERFQKAFNFPRLKYLRITAAVIGFPNTLGLQYPDIEINMFKSCVNLEALRLENFSTPSSQTVVSLHQNLKHLNYLCISGQTIFTWTLHCYVNLKHYYWFDMGKLHLDRFGATYYYDESLERTVFVNGEELYSRLCSPKISSHTVDWISLGKDIIKHGYV